MANARFFSGTRSVPTGVTDLSVTGLSMPFTPSSVIVSVRQPSASAPLVSAYVTGEPTTDGFSVTLNAPASADGYLLDFTVFSEGASPAVAGDTLAVGYEDLVKSLAAYLGYDATALTARETAAIDSYIQSGVRRFYYPPKMDGVDDNYEWSFIRQGGTLATSAGVGAYQMPDGINRIAGQITVAGDEGRSIPIIPYGDIVRMRERGETGRPRFAALVFEQAFGTRGQSKRLHLYPTPDREYTLQFVCDADTGKLDAETRPFPLGGAMFSELVTESCLAVAEQMANDVKDIHTQNFNELLVAMISRDRKSSAQCFGDIGDPDARGCSAFRPLRTRGFLI